jgi:hypothetical protein
MLEDFRMINKSNYHNPNNVQNNGQTISQVTIQDSQEDKESPVSKEKK